MSITTWLFCFYVYQTERLSLGRQNYMDNLFSLIENGSGKIKLEVSGEDLFNFSTQLINRAKEELVSLVVEKNSEEIYLTKADVKHLCGICDATVWHWQKRGYLSPIRIGRKVMYRKSDIDKIINPSKAQ